MKIQVAALLSSMAREGDELWTCPPKSIFRLGSKRALSDSDSGHPSRRISDSRDEEMEQGSPEWGGQEQMELAGPDVRGARTTRACPADQRLLRAPPPFSPALPLSLAPTPTPTPECITAHALQHPALPTTTAQATHLTLGQRKYRIPPSPAPSHPTPFPSARLV